MAFERAADVNQIKRHNMNPVDQPALGMPIHEDSRVRSIVDSLDERDASEDWYPSNKLAIRLWQALEALRDIEVALESAHAQKNATKQKRQLKQFSVQLHSLATAVVRLCDQMIGDEDARRWLEAGTSKQISVIKSEFLELLPIDHSSDLSVLRNRMGGHIDRELAPWDAREILSRKAISNFGRWMHVSACDVGSAEARRLRLGRSRSRWLPSPYDE